MTFPETAVILAAGIGSRLRPITLRKPKCSVTVDGTPILEYQLRAYAESGLDEVVVVAGYLSEKTRALAEGVAAEYDAFSVTVVENEVYANTDNMYSLSLVEPLLDGEPFFLSNGDVVFDPEVVEQLAAADADSAIACDTSLFSEEAMKVTADDRDCISSISKEYTDSEAHAVSIDLYRFSGAFSAALFDEIERSVEQHGEYGGWTELAIDRLLKSGRFDVEPVDIAGARWVEIDDLDDLAAADLRFASLRPLDEKRAAFFDLDGTVYLGDELIGGAAEIVTELREAGVDVFFLSNNSSRWKPGYVEKLRNLGISATPESVILSTDGVIAYLESVGTDETYVVGTEAMRDALRERGFAVESDDPTHVVVGFDTELTYEKVRRATLAIHDGAEFLLAHPDAVCPTDEGPIPDCGSIGALVETAVGRPPAHVFGKPNPEMLLPTIEEYGYEPEDVVVVGDRLETELRMADRIGCESVCVLTGDADRADVEASDISPSLVAPSIATLSEFL
ncbi:HAD-IIA family hydrolase [Haloprofundus halobius]|uniref:HAD-IIA family hydrolase n=1 Tax=Haloprofundus halobius TaxID=2876194 RepID=UPI001CCBEF9E|nr:HAD-IIA family hydrolase [Haloprofundus halobius]